MRQKSVYETRVYSKYRAPHTSFFVGSSTLLRVNASLRWGFLGPLFCLFSFWINHVRTINAVSGCHCCLGGGDFCYHVSGGNPCCSGLLLCWRGTLCAFQSSTLSMAASTICTDFIYWRDLLCGYHIRDYCCLD